MLGPQGTWTATFCGLDGIWLSTQTSRHEVSQQMPTLLAPIKFTVNMSSLYHELLTSHLMTIIFVKQPKQRSLALENSRPYIP